MDARQVAAALAALQARLKSMGKSGQAIADLVDLNVPQGALIGQLRLLRRLVAQSGLSDMLGVNLNDSQIKEQLQKLSSLDATINVGADTTDAGTALAAFQARIRALGDTLTNLRLGVDTKDAEAPIAALQARLATLAEKVAKVVFRGDTAELDAKIAKEQANLAGLQQKMSDLQMDADTKRLVAKIAGMEKQAADLGDKLDRLSPDIDIRAGLAELDLLDARVAELYDALDHLPANADTSEILAKIDELEGRAAELHAELDDLTADVDIRAVLAKLDSVGADLKALQSEAAKTKLGADATALLTAITASESRIAAMKAEAADIRLGKVDTAALAGIDAEVLKIEADVAKITAAMGPPNAAVTAMLDKVTALRAAMNSLRANADTAQAQGAIGRLDDQANVLAARLRNLPVNVSDVQLAQAAAQVNGLDRAVAALGDTGKKTAAVPIFRGGWWGASVLGIGAWHIALDAALEALIAVGTSALALGAAAAAVYPSVDQLTYSFKNMIAVQATFHENVGPLNQALTNLQAAMAPQVIEAFGGALTLLTRQTGALAQTARVVVGMFDTWIAKINLWSQSQKGFGQFFQTGTAYLAQFGKLFGILGQAIDNLLKKDPGVAHFLLDFLQGIAEAINLFSKLPAPIVVATLALHGLYLWTKVLVAAPVLAMARALGILSAEQASAAASGLKFQNVLKFLVTTPWGWAAIGAAAIAYMAYEMNQASSVARTFIGNMESGLGQLSASSAIPQISADIGQLRSQIQATFSPQYVSQVEATYGGLSGRFQSNMISMGAAAADLGKGIASLFSGHVTGAIRDFGAAVSQATDPKHGAAMVQTANDASAYRGEIVKLTGEQNNLFAAAGALVRQGFTVSQSFALMDLAGVRAGDTYAVMVQKVQDLIAGYKAMSIQGGMLANSVNAMNFATAQQDSKVTQLNSAWDAFFKTVSGGVSGYTAFQTQVAGLDQVLGANASRLTISSGRVRITLSGQGQAAQAAAASMSGLNAASLQARNTFVQTADAANTEIDNLSLLTSAAGLGKRGTDLLTQSVRDMVAQLLPAAKGSSELTDILYALAQRGGYQGADSFKALSAWVGQGAAAMSKAGGPAQDLNNNVATLTHSAAGLTKDVQNLTMALGQTMTGAMAAATLQATGGQKVFDAFATALRNTGFSSSRTLTTGTALAKSLITLTGNTADARNEFISWATQMTGNQKAATDLWNAILPLVSKPHKVSVTADLRTTKKNIADLGKQLAETTDPAKKRQIEIRIRILEQRAEIESQIAALEAELSRVTDPAKRRQIQFEIKVDQRKLDEVNGRLDAVSGHADKARAHLGGMADPGLWGRITSAAGSAAGKISSFFAGSFAKTNSQLNAFGSQVQGFFTGKFVSFFTGTVGPAITGAWAHVWSGLVSPVVHAFDSVKNAITSGFDGWWKTHGAIIKQTWDAVWHDISSGTAGVARQLTQWAKVIWDGITGFFRSGSSATQGIWKSFWGVLESVGKAFWQLFGPIVKSGWDVAAGIFKAVTGTIESIVKAFWDTLAALAKAAWATLKAIIKIGWDAIVAVFSVALDLITGHWKTAWNDITSFGHQVWNNLRGFYSSAWAAFRTDFDQVLNLIKGAWQNTWNAISNIGHQVWNNIKSGVSDVVASVRTTWNTLSGIFRGPVSFLVNTVYDGGIARLWNDVMGAIGGPKLPTFKFAEGGRIPGYAPGVDSYPAMLSGGEFIFTPEAASAIGYDELDRINKLHSRRRTGYAAGGEVPGFASGGRNPPGTPPGGPVGQGLHTGTTAQPTGGNPLSGLLHGIEHILGKAFDLAKIGAALATGNGTALANALKAFIGPGGAKAELAQMIVGIPETMVKDAIGVAVSAAKKSAAAQSAKGMANPGGGGTARWIPAIEAVLRMLGLINEPGALLTVLAQMNTESGGNPTIVNKWDSNWAAGHPCLTLDCMILTRRGWLNWEDVRAGDETLGYNPKTQRSEWTRVTHVHYYEDAEVWRIGNKHWHADVTPNHRWWSDTRAVLSPESLTACPECGWAGRTDRPGLPSASPRSISTHRGRMHGIRNEPVVTSRGEFVQTRDLGHGHRIRLAAPADTDGIPGLSLEDVRVLAWLQGDGNVSRAYRQPVLTTCPECGWLPGHRKPSRGPLKPEHVPNSIAVHRAKTHGVAGGGSDPSRETADAGWDGSIYQSKPSQVVKIRALLADVPHTENIRERGGNMMPAHQFKLRREYVTDLMKRSRLPETGPEAFVLALSPDQRGAWLDSMTDAEGHRQPVRLAEGGKRRGAGGEFVRIAQVDGPLQDAIKLAVYLEGYRPTFSPLSAKSRGYQPSGHVGMARPHIAPSMFSPHQVLERQPVWCVTTELGTWTAEQDGLPFLTGNSVGLMQVIGPTFAAYAGPFRNTGPFEYGVSTNGEANIYAGLNYAIHAYGNPGWLSVLGHGHGYSAGGRVPGYALGGIAAYRAKLAGEQAQAQKFYGQAEAARKGIGKRTLDELGTLSRREAAEVAAYKAIAGTGLSKSALDHLGSMAREENLTAHDLGLSRQPGIGGLQSALSALYATAHAPPPLGGGTGGGSGGGGGGTGGGSGGGSGSGGHGSGTPAQLVAKVKAAQKLVTQDYARVAAAGQRTGLSKTTRDELGTLARREAAEVAAYSAAIRNPTVAAMKHLGSVAREEARTARDKGLSSLSGIGSLQRAAAEMAALTGDVTAAGSGGSHGGGSHGGSGGSAHPPKITAAWLASLRADWQRQQAAYRSLAAAFGQDLKHPVKGSWTYGHKTGLTSELGTLAKRESAATAAVSAVLKSGTKTTRSELDHLVSALNAVARTAQDKDLSYGGAGGHPALDKALLQSTDAMVRLAGGVPPGGSGSGGSGGGSGGSGGKGRGGGLTHLTRAQLQQLAADEAKQRAAYGAFHSGYASAVASAKKGSWIHAHRSGITSELATLAKRENAEIAAYSAVEKAGTKASKSELDHLAATVREVITTTRDADLSSRSSGFLGRDQAVQSRSNAILKLLGQAEVPGTSGSGAGPGGGGYTGPTDVIPGNIPAATARWLDTLRADQKQEYRAWWNFDDAWKRTLNHPAKGSFAAAHSVTLNKALYLLGARQSAEEAAYDNVFHHGTGSANLVKYASRLREVISSAQDRYLSYAGPGGHPAWDKGIQQWAGALLKMVTSGNVPFFAGNGVSDNGRSFRPPPWNPGPLGPSHTVSGGVIQFDTGRNVLPPGLSLTWNGTGRDEPLSSHGARFGGGCGEVHLHLHNHGVIGSQAELENWFIRTANHAARTGRLAQAVKTANR